MNFLNILFFIHENCLLSKFSNGYLAKNGEQNSQKAMAPE